MVQSISRTVYPLTSPAMQCVGSDFISWAEHRNCSIEDVIYDCLYRQGQYKMNLSVTKSHQEMFHIIPGHRWGDEDVLGPVRQHRVMIVTHRMEQDDHEEHERWFAGNVGRILLKYMKERGIKRIADFYVTGALKTPSLNPDKAFQRSWADQQKILLMQELAIVRPEFVLALGTEACKSMLGSKFTLGSAEGRVLPQSFDFTEPGEPLDVHTVQVIPCMHPFAVVVNPTPAVVKRFSGHLKLFKAATSMPGDVEDPVDDLATTKVITVRTLEKLKKVLKKANRELNKERLVAFDAEWEGAHPQNDGAFIRCIQFAWTTGKACVLSLTNDKGEPEFTRINKRTGKRTLQGAKQAAYAEILHFMRDKRTCGHFFNADLEHLVYDGLDLRPQHYCPDKWELCRTQGGLDTAHTAHAIDETGDFTLTGQILTYTDMPRYDHKLLEYKKEFCRQRKMKSSDLGGYGYFAEEILYPYAAADADGTLRVALAHLPLMDCDSYGNNCWEHYFQTFQASAGALEITRTGLMLDHQRVDELTIGFMQKREELLKRIRTLFNWPDLNMCSVFQVRELLFGTKYNCKFDDEGKNIRLRPPGAKSLHIIPLLTSGKYPKDWAEVEESGEIKKFSPSTNRQSLALMLFEGDKLRVRVKEGKGKFARWVVKRKDCSKYLKVIQDYRFVKQALSGVLRDPVMDENEAYDVDSDGNYVYEKGVAGSVCSDGMVRPFVTLLKETCRAAMSRPNLQAVAKKREKDYKRILGDAYCGTLRSILRAPPGWFIVEADYIGAELLAMGIMSQDAMLLDHAIRNQLPESDPNYYEIHSNIAKMAFSLDCPATKAGLIAAGHEGLRTAAKSVIFGLAYGRGAKAIVIGAKEEQVEISVEEAQRLINFILYEQYTELPAFFDSCAECVARGWMQNTWGMYRRFPAIHSRKDIAAQEREAKNAPIQSFVAGAVNRAVRNFGEYRKKHKMRYLTSLVIHDAVQLIVPAEEVEEVKSTVMPHCMVKCVPLYPSTLDGQRIHVKKPYRFGIDTDVHVRWGEVAMPNEFLDYNVSPTVGGWVESSDGWKHKEFKGQAWDGQRLITL